jgi:hypothetical protein
MNYSPKSTQRVEDINMRGGRLDVRKKTQLFLPLNVYYYGSICTRLKHKIRSERKPLRAPLAIRTT